MGPSEGHQLLHHPQHMDTHHHSWHLQVPRANSASARSHNHIRSVSTLGNWCKNAQNLSDLQWTTKYDTRRWRYKLNTQLTSYIIYQGCVTGILNVKSWSLKGVLIVFRHGDRGPLQHIRNVSTVDCGTPETDLLAAYRAYLHNATLLGKSSAWTGPGSFHGFPLIPTNARRCHLGQLTMRGVAQLLTLGDQLKHSYTETWPRAKNLTAGDVAVYSTRYHRTFQSALALLYGLIPAETLSKLSFIESQSMTFCFKDCGCPITEKYFK